MKACSSFLFPIIALTATVAFCFIAQFNGLYGQDAHEYYRVAAGFLKYYSGKGAIPVSFFPSTYPFVCSLFGLLLPLPMACQLVSILSVLLTVVVIRKLLTWVYGGNLSQAAYIWCVAFPAAYFFRIGICSMSDSLALLLLTVATYNAVRFHLNPSYKWLMMMLVVSAFAVLTRFVMAFPLTVMVAYVLWRKRGEVRLTSVMAAALLAILLASPLLYLSLHSWSVNGANNSLFQSWSLHHFLHNTFNNKGEGLYTYQHANWLFNLFPLAHPGFILLAPLLFFQVRKSDFQNHWWRLWLVVTLSFLVFLMGIAHQNTRHQLTVFPFLICLYYPAFDRAWQWVKGKHATSAFVAGILIAQLALIYKATSAIRQSSLNDKKMAAAVYGASANGLVYEMSASGLLSTYHSGLKTVSLFDNAVYEVPCTSLLLIQPEVIATQWKQRLPELNFNTLMLQCDTTRLASFESGWQLYRLQKRTCK